MKINADFSKIAVVVPTEDAWVRSPESGVDRLMLDRIGDEVARATSIVRYAAGSSFPEHSHAKGEEFIVLDGVFSDESGDFPKGSYVRNPPGSSHAPGSKDGCRILVKLRQFDPEDLAHVVINTGDESLWEESGDGTGKLPLHVYGDERVEMRRMGAGATLDLGHAGGTEVFVISGLIQLNSEEIGAEGWFRLPPGGETTLAAGVASVIWVKTGHLTGL